MVQIEPGHLLAEITVRGKHTAIIDIFFDNKTFSIKYKESVNLGYDGDSIHWSYNLWIRNLKKDIQTEMQLIGVSWSPKPPSPVIEASTTPAHPSKLLKKPGVLDHGHPSTGGWCGLGTISAIC